MTSHLMWCYIHNAAISNNKPSHKAIPTTPPSLTTSHCIIQSPWDCHLSLEEPSHNNISMMKPSLTIIHLSRCSLSMPPSLTMRHPSVAISKKSPFLLQSHRKKLSPHCRHFSRWAIAPCNLCPQALPWHISHNAAILHDKPVHDAISHNDANSHDEPSHNAIYHN